MFRKILTTLLIVVGLGLIASPFVMDWMVSHIATQQLAQVDPSEFESNLELEVDFDFDVIESIEMGDVFAALNQDVPVIGEIMIPSVDIHLPIIHGVSNVSLSIGAGTMKPGQVMGEGNYALASHRMNNPNLLFTPLERVELGDLIYLLDANYRFVYKITMIEVVQPYRVDVIEDTEGANLVTLITCTEDGTERLKVRGELLEVLDR